jgi:hypothetical protein
MTTTIIRNPRTPVSLLLSLLLLLVMTACTSTPDPTESSDVAEPITEVVESDPTDIAADQAVLGLSGEGIRAILPTGSIRTITFESDIDTAQTVATNLLGEPSEVVENTECPAGALTIITWSNGFTLNAAQNQFVGWGVQPTDAESAKLTTIDGIGVGSSLSELQELYDVEVYESSLGTEFSTGQISGLLTANEADAVITTLWAGTNCIFR